MLAYKCWDVLVEISKKCDKDNIEYENAMHWLPLLPILHAHLLFEATKPLGMQASIFGACPKPG